MLSELPSTEQYSPALAVPREPILILDDEPEVLDALRERLEAEGYKCTTCISPLTALHELEHSSFSLLITDLMMTEMDGIEVVRKFKQHDPNVASIVVTALTDITKAIQALRAGADDYILKPFNLHEISVCVSRALEKRHLILENRRYQEELEQRVREATEELKDANRELLRTKDYLESLIESTVDAIITIDPEGRISFANRGALRMLGFSEEELIGRKIASVYSGGIEEAMYIRRVLRPENPLQNYETELLHRSQAPIPVSISLSIVPDPDGKAPSTLAICKDITEQKRLEVELKELTIRDGLTGLYNQRYFYERLEAEIERARRQRRPLSLLLVDIDHFKTYNDAHGHLEGDKVLQAVAEVLKECTREHVDMAFRYGGDEFTVLLPEAPEEQARQIAERVRMTFEAKRFDLLTLSIGLMAYREEQTLRNFIQFTDSMMYDAKRAGGNRVYVYSAHE